MADNKTIWTIGHSNRTIETFIDILHSHNIQLIVDVRQFPGSKKYPYFNKEQLQISLKENNINYEHLVQLGGRRKLQKIHRTSHGKMMLSGLMQTIWKQMSLQKR